MENDVFMPIRDEKSTEFFDYLQKGKLSLRYCNHCKKYNFLNQEYCNTCFGKTEWKAVSGRGRIQTWSANYQVVHESFKKDVPYIIGAIILAEGPIVFSRIENCNANELDIGLPVGVRFKMFSNGECIPYFELEE